MNASKHILVVEDERIVARDIQGTLIDFGYQVPATASSCEQALIEPRCLRAVVDTLLLEIGIIDRAESAS